MTPDGVFALVSNFNLHGDPIPSSVSAAYLPEMARIETCVRPHGGAISPLGDFHYSVCVGDEQLVVISVESLEVVDRRSLPGCGPHLGGSGAFGLVQPPCS